MNIVLRSIGIRTPSFPYIQISGQITRQTTIYVDNMLKELPKSAQKLGIVINSSKGSLAQAHIIRTKLKLLSKNRGIQIYTFIEDSAVNAGFLLANSGQKIFADTSSIIGGLEVSAQKLIVNDLIQRITYKNDASIASEMNHLNEIDPAKKLQVQKVFNAFSKQAENQIRLARKTNQNIDLGELYPASKAKELGLIDGFGRVNQKIPQDFPSLVSFKLTETLYDRIKKNLINLNIW